MEKKRIITVPLELKIKIDNSGNVKVTSKLLTCNVDYTQKNSVSPNIEIDNSYIVVCAIYDHYKNNIKATSRLTNGGIKKIKQRLISYSESELRIAIENFSKNSWWMQNNSGRGVEWFFKSDARIDMFLNLDVKQATGPITIK